MIDNKFMPKITTRETFLKGNKKQVSGLCEEY